MSIFYSINYMDYHFNICFFPVQADAFLTMYVWCCGLITRISISSSGFFLLNVSRRDLCLIANDLMIWKPNSISHVKTFPLQSIAKFSSPVLWNEVKSCSKIRYPAQESCRFQLTGHWGFSVVSFWQITPCNQSIAWSSYLFPSSSN